MIFRRFYLDYQGYVIERPVQSITNQKNKAGGTKSYNNINATHYTDNGR
jgi:hypothetical protein